MVAFTSFIAAVAAIAGSVSVVSAEYLMVVNHITQSGGNEVSGACRDNANSYEIYSMNQQISSSLTGCNNLIPGKLVSWSQRKSGSMLEGCQAGNYNNGYRVCLTSYGANVHNNKGQHQRCNTVDRSIGLCPNGWCFDKPRLQLQCQGVWHKD